MQYAVKRIKCIPILTIPDKKVIYQMYLIMRAEAVRMIQMYLIMRAEAVRMIQMYLIMRDEAVRMISALDDIHVDYKL